jgi:hypothetical protein
MADKGTWILSTSESISGTEQSSQVIYFKLGPAQGPVVVYRVHNDGPLDVMVLISGLAPPNPPGFEPVVIEPGTDCDISGSGLEFGTGIQVRLDLENLIKGETGNASGTYELMCCHPTPQ